MVCADGSVHTGPISHSVRRRYDPFNTADWATRTNLASALTPRKDRKLLKPARQEVKGRKRHIITDTLGLMLFVLVHNAHIQDRDGAPDLLRGVYYGFPWLRHVFADGGYAVEKPCEALQDNGDWTIEIIKRSDTAKGFQVLPRRRVVERTFAWLGRCRRLAKEWERSIESAPHSGLVVHFAPALYTLSVESDIHFRNNSSARAAAGSLPA